MSDEPAGIYQPENEPAGQPVEKQEDNQPKYVTEETLRAELDKFWKGVQSMTTKQEKRVSKQLEEWEKRVTDAGITVSTDMRNAAQERIALSMLEDDSKVAKPAAPLKPYDDPVVADVNKWIDEVQQQYGFQFTDNDPEWYEINFHNPNPEAFKRQFESKLSEAASRAGKPIPQKPVQSGNPSARVPAPAGVSVNNLDFLNQELAQLQAKSNPTRAEEQRRKEIVAELLRQVPKG